jgi:hypothetical protein
MRTRWLVGHADLSTPSEFGGVRGIEQAIRAIHQHWTPVLEYSMSARHDVDHMHPHIEEDLGRLEPAGAEKVKSDGPLQSFSCLRRCKEWRECWQWNREFLRITKFMHCPPGRYQ